MANEQVQAAIKELQDALVVMAHLEKRQTDRIAQTEEEVDRLVEALHKAQDMFA